MHKLFDNPAAFKPFFGDGVAAAYKGSRREDGVSRRIFTSVDVFVQRESKKENTQSDAVAMGGGYTWEISFPADKWLYVSDPQISDSIEFVDPGCNWNTVRVRVASVAQDCGWWVLKARPDGGV